MRKINVQRDIESRKNMAQAFSATVELEATVETVKEENDAESEKKDGQTDHASAPAGEKQKKGRRQAEGNV